MEQLYLELLKKSLLGELYRENEVRLLYLRDCAEGRDSYSAGTLLHIYQRRRAFCERHREGNRTGRFVDDLVENLGKGSQLRSKRSIGPACSGRRPRRRSVDWGWSAGIPGNAVRKARDDLPDIAGMEFRGAYAPRGFAVQRHGIVNGDHAAGAM